MENTPHEVPTQISAQSYAINGLGTTQTAVTYSYNQNYLYAANLMVNGDKNSYEVKRALLERGVTESEADVMIDRLENEVEEARKARANKDMLWGAVWCIGGTIITVATYSGGGTAVFCWGAILFGGIQFVKGLMASMK